MEELRYSDPDYSTGSSELVNQTGVGKPIAVTMELSLANMELSLRIEETHASQPKIIPCWPNMFAACKKQLSWCFLCKSRATWNEVGLYLCWKWVLCLVVFGCVSVWL